MAPPPRAVRRALKDGTNDPAPTSDWGRMQSAQDACVRPSAAYRGTRATRITVCPAGPLVHAIVASAVPAATTG